MWIPEFQQEDKPKPAPKATFHELQEALFGESAPSGATTPRGGPDWGAKFGETDPTTGPGTLVNSYVSIYIYILSPLSRDIRF